MQRGTWGWDGPPEEAYSRVSDPTLYLALHPVADRLVSRLISRYRVEAEPGGTTGPWRDIERATRLTPDGGGAPVTLVWTGPGVAVRAGHAYQRGFPSCGCDACDEDPDWLVGELEETVEMVVAGGLTETRRPLRYRRGDDVTVELRDGAGRSSGMDGPLTTLDAIPLGTTAWPPWLPR